MPHNLRRRMAITKKLEQDGVLEKDRAVVVNLCQAVPINMLFQVVVIVERSVAHQAEAWPFRGFTKLAKVAWSGYVEGVLRPLEAMRGDHMVASYVSIRVQHKLSWNTHNNPIISVERFSQR